MSEQTMKAAPPTQAHIVQYCIRSSDAIAAESRINVFEEGTENVLWYKERIMTEDEIIESVMDAVTKNLVWSIHRPRQGWYLRLVSPSFPTGVSIPLIPPPPKLPQAELPTSTSGAAVATGAEDGTLTFSVRTCEPPQSPKPSSEADNESGNHVQIAVTEHSYPPSPPQLPSRSSSQTLTVPSNEQIQTKLAALKPPMIRQFMLMPSLPSLPPSATGAKAFITRALSYITPRLPIRATYSFTLAPAGPINGGSLPLLTFTDRTSTFAVSTTGLLEINKGLEHQLGIDPSFWIAVSLAYLEFLGDRDSYLAASEG